jgi:hypothetical protein
METTYRPPDTRSLPLQGSLGRRNSSRNTVAFEAGLRPTVMVQEPDDVLRKHQAHAPKRSVRLGDARRFESLAVDARGWKHHSTGNTHRSRTAPAHGSSSAATPYLSAHP